MDINKSSEEEEKNEIGAFSAINYLEFYLKDKVDDILFVQPRVGKGGKIFNCYKIRTKIKGTENNPTDADNRGEKTENDPRNIKGREWLRVSGIDEAPQIMNLLKGDMSFFGARPLPEEEHSLLSEHGKYLRELYTPGYCGLHAFVDGGKLENREAAEEYLKWKQYYDTRNMWERFNFNLYVLYMSGKFLIGGNNK